MSIIGATCYYFGFAILASTLFFWLCYRTRARELRRLMWRNLDSAYEGGQFSRAEQGPLWGLPALDIAADMELYCEDLSGYDRNELMPHVYAWMIRQGMWP
jgi:hypothetical protein